MSDSPIIVALDCAEQELALQFAHKVEPSSCALKVGSELFTACGPIVVEKLVKLGFRVFLDLKFHDIPHTVAKACKSAIDLGVWMLNIHASGGREMMVAAREAVDGGGLTERPLLIAVTVLTSMDDAAFQDVACLNTIPEQVQHLASLAYSEKLDGVVCSAHEAAMIKAATGPGFCTVTPGIRLASDPCHDQKRVMTPKDAIANMSDYLVIGRAITKADSPSHQLNTILRNLRLG